MGLSLLSLGAVAGSASLPAPAVAQSVSYEKTPREVWTSVHFAERWLASVTYRYQELDRISEQSHPPGDLAALAARMAEAKSALDQGRLLEAEELAESVLSDAQRANHQLSKYQAVEEARQMVDSFAEDVSSFSPGANESHPDLDLIRRRFEEIEKLEVREAQERRQELQTVVGLWEKGMTWYQEGHRDVYQQLLRLQQAEREAETLSPTRRDSAHEVLAWTRSKLEDGAHYIPEGYGNGNFRYPPLEERFEVVVDGGLERLKKLHQEQSTAEALEMIALAGSGVSLAVAGWALNRRSRKSEAQVQERWAEAKTDFAEKGRQLSRLRETAEDTGSVELLKSVGESAKLLTEAEQKLAQVGAPTPPWALWNHFRVGDSTLKTQLLDSIEQAGLDQALELAHEQRAGVQLEQARRDEVTGGRQDGPALLAELGRKMMTGASPAEQTRLLKATFHCILQHPQVDPRVHRLASVGQGLAEFDQAHRVIEVLEQGLAPGDRAEAGFYLELVEGSNSEICRALYAALARTSEHRSSFLLMKGMMLNGEGPGIARKGLELWGNGNMGEGSTLARQVLRQGAAAKTRLKLLRGAVEALSSGRLDPAGLGETSLLERLDQLSVDLRAEVMALTESASDGLEVRVGEDFVEVGDFSVPVE